MDEAQRPEEAQDEGTPARDLPVEGADELPDEVRDGDVAAGEEEADGSNG